MNLFFNNMFIMVCTAWLLISDLIFLEAAQFLQDTV